MTDRLTPVQPRCSPLMSVSDSSRATDPASAFASAPTQRSVQRVAKPSPRRHRWVEEEPEIPFELEVLYEDDGIIVVDKPHFLATTPRGMWYRQSALMRLRERFGEPDITPAHRLDRATAGIVLFVRKPRLRRTYQTLFEHHDVTKEYECLAPAAPIVRPRYGTIERLRRPAVFPLLRRSTIVKERGRLQAFEVPGRVNAQTWIDIAERGVESRERWPASQGPVPQGPAFGSASGFASGFALQGTRTACVRRYILRPRTGKTHQLRVHMNALGLPIVGDELYPRVVNPAYDDFSNPLQLVARSLSFVDPITGEERRFVSRIALDMPA